MRLGMMEQRRLFYSDMTMSRLTAIRETFEESGILLHKTGTEAGAFSFEDREMLSEWRTRVHKEPGSLLRLYRYMILVFHWSIL